MSVPARKANVADTTGAGDTLNGAFALQRAKERIWRQHFGMRMWQPAYPQKNSGHRAECRWHRKSKEELENWEEEHETTGDLNSDISRVLSYMGHTDTICIGDCGLPIPDETERIDLAVKFGQPSFMDVLEEVGADMKVEKIILAEEMKLQNPEILRQIEQFLQSMKRVSNQRYNLFCTAI